jgi:cytidine deaminase
MNIDWQALIDAARAARDGAYAPYSLYPVGAAVLCGSGSVYRGCNIENAAYGAAMCAERTALFAAYAAGEREFVALAVIAESDRPVPPCGVCRQVLVELAADMPVVLANMDGNTQHTTPRDLLPGAFGPHDLATGMA